MELPPLLGNFRPFSEFIQTVLPPLVILHDDKSVELMLLFITEIVQFGGIFIAYLFFLRQPGFAEKFSTIGIVGSVKKFWLAGWDFDALYERLFIGPFLWLTRVTKGDVIDSAYNGIGSLNRSLNEILSRTQNGNIRWYAAGIAFGAVVFLGIVVLLQ